MADSDCAASPKRVYLPGSRMQGEEELVHDKDAYQMYHEAQTAEPCLSFDIIPDNLGDWREDYPLTCFVIAGTQQAGSSRDKDNIVVMKMSNLTGTKQQKMHTSDSEDDSESSSESSDDENLDSKPELEAVTIHHNGAVNRIRCQIHDGQPLAASWSERGVVYVWDFNRPLAAVNDDAILATYTRNEESPEAIFEFAGHQSEGFALDWSPTLPGRLATGDCKKNIHVWMPCEGGQWTVEQRPLIGHKDSVEDIQWSPNEQSVLASCSVDRSLRIWDVRARPTQACMVKVLDAHQSDINVLNWNRLDALLVTGGDDGVIKIWDLRQLSSGRHVALFKHHISAITSVEWNHHDSTVFAASGADEQLTIWDLSTERERTEPAEMEPDVPPQLLFIHQGQKDIKELHWHRQLPGVIISTALSGFNIFRTISV